MYIVLNSAFNFNSFPKQMPLPWIVYLIRWLNNNNNNNNYYYYYYYRKVNHHWLAHTPNTIYKILKKFVLNFFLLNRLNNNGIAIFGS